MLAQARSFRVGQRATVPNLPGRWVLAETGPLAGMWLRESATAHLDGFVERTGFAGGVQLRLRSAVHLGRRFAADGGVRATRSWTVTATTSVMADARAIINGRPYWHIGSGRLDGYWLAESAVAFKPGSIGRLELPGAPAIDLGAGTYTGYRYGAQGAVTGSQTVHYGTRALRHGHRLEDRQRASALPGGQRRARRHLAARVERHAPARLSPAPPNRPSHRPAVPDR